MGDKEMSASLEEGMGVGGYSGLHGLSSQRGFWGGRGSGSGEGGAVSPMRDDSRSMIMVILARTVGESLAAWALAKDLCAARSQPVQGGEGMVRAIVRDLSVRVKWGGGR